MSDVTAQPDKSRWALAIVCWIAGLGCLYAQYRGVEIDGTAEAKTYLESVTNLPFGVWTLAIVGKILESIFKVFLSSIGVAIGGFILLGLGAAVVDPSNQ